MELSAEQLRSLPPDEAARKVENLLPPVRESPMRSEIEYYGAADVIAGRIGLSTTPPTLPRTVSWHHGPVRPPLWGLAELDPPIPEQEMDYPFHMAPKGALRLLVHRKEEAFFDSLGSVAHLAVGAPFCYVEASGLSRIEGTLLAMPSHSFVGCGSNHRLGLADHYAAYLDGLRATFSFVCVCLYADDFADEGMRGVYRRHCLPVVRGAGIKDRNSLHRMRRLFDAFECMTSNDVGSHVVYASSAGCRVFLTEHSLFGEKRAIWEKHPFYANRPNVLANVLRCNDPAFLRQQWPWLYRGEASPTANLAWAEEMLGVENLRPPVEIARLLGWRYPFDGEPSREDFLKYAPLLGHAAAQPKTAPQKAPACDSRGKRPQPRSWRQRVRRALGVAKRALLGKWRRNGTHGIGNAR